MLDKYDRYIMLDKIYMLHLICHVYPDLHGFFNSIRIDCREDF